jgi:hypothetical protein
MVTFAMRFQQTIEFSKAEADLVADASFSSRNETAAQCQDEKWGGAATGAPRS